MCATVPAAAFRRPEGFPLLGNTDGAPGSGSGKPLALRQRMPEPVSLLVLGLGDSTRGDDGLGAAAIGRLRSAWIVPAGVHVSEGRLPPGLESPDAALLVDAVAADAPAGAFIRLDGNRAVPAISERLPGLAGSLLERDPRRLVLVGLVPELVGPHPGLSRRVAAGLEGLVRRMVLEARQLGHEFRPRRPREPDGGAWTGREG
jgi:hydrogenase maturation protease